MIAVVKKVSYAHSCGAVFFAIIGERLLVEWLHQLLFQQGILKFYQAGHCSLTGRYFLLSGLLALLKTGFCLVEYCPSFFDIRLSAVRSNFNYSRCEKFEPDVPNNFGEILLEKSQNLQIMYELINVLPPSNFAVFDCCYFLCYWLQRAQTCTLLKLKLFQFLNLICIYHVFYGLSPVPLMSKHVNNNVTMNP